MAESTAPDLSALPDDEFRARLRAFLQQQYPDDWRQDHRRPFRRLRGMQAMQWLRMLHAHGLRAPSWPREYGGMGLSFGKLRIYQDEFEQHGVARIVDIGETLLGPTLIQFGTAEQKAHYLPRILDCTDVWCQGYSEPNAGSDLASLRTHARREGDDFIINGQKIWTTQANDSTHIFVLARTGKFPKKQQGISFLLAELNAPGIRVRPIINLAGEDEFCEVFLDEVRVPASSIVGEIDQGWTVTKALLGHERVFIGSPALCGKAVALARQLVQEAGLSQDVGVRDRLAQLECDLHDHRLMYAEACDALAAGKHLGAEVSALKVYASELLQRLTEFNVEVAAEYGGVIGDVQIGETLTDLHWQFMMSRPVTIFAGASEVQRDILAKSVLGLPAV